MKPSLKLGTPVINPNFYYLKKGDKLYLFSSDTDDNEFIELDGSGPELWRILTKAKSMSEFFTEIENVFHSTLTNDQLQEVEDFLERLINLQVLEIRI